ncbi:MAG: thymidine phosphorylase [archaeon]|nr:thymidine phosphorylase [archaeon]MCR4323804.1 thymidine phosphorylase [Nanoarchaeota archaeon]
MKLKIKNLNWLAGRPVVFLNEETAKEMNVFANDRVAISNDKKIYAVVDIFPQIVKRNEIGLSKELTKALQMRNNSLVEVTTSEISNATALIGKKMRGGELTKEELNYLISEIVHNNITEAEIAYFTSAEKLQGMTMGEVVNLTKAMIKTGARLNFEGKYIADKHCIGGVAGNRTTPLVISICAVAGLTLPKTSSKAITSAAGTADVVETISNIEFPLKKIKKIVEENGACLVWGGSLGLAPADDKIIRVERLMNFDIEPQLLASIMSKKISVGSKYLIIDIPYGEGSKIDSLIKAKRLGRKFTHIAHKFKLKIKVVYTDGSEPIGNGVGPNLEMLDLLLILRNSPEAPKDLRKKALFLSSELMKLCGIKNSKEKAEEILNSGKAYQKFKEIINAQNGINNFDEKVSSLKFAKFKKTIVSSRTGKITQISNKGINSLCRILGTPETKTAGVYLHKHTGKITKGEKMITLYSESKSKLKEAKQFLKEFKPIKLK